MSDSPSDRAVVFAPSDAGLANRLRALAGYAAMSRCVFGRPVRVYWAPHRTCPAAFSELFASADVELLDAKAFRRLPPETVETAVDWFQLMWKQRLEETVPWPQYLAEVRRFLDGLTPRESIARAAGEFDAEAGLGEAVGLHIRYTDNVVAHRLNALRYPNLELSKQSRLEGFRRLIESRPQQRFFLATDNAAVEKDFLTAFGGRVLVRPKRYGWFGRVLETVRPAAGFRSSSVSDALVEILLLARCREVVGTYYSSFGEFAAVWGRRSFSTIQGDQVVPAVHLNETIAQLRAVD